MPATREAIPSSPPSPSPPTHFPARARGRSPFPRAPAWALWSVPAVAFWAAAGGMSDGPAHRHPRTPEQARTLYVALVLLCFSLLSVHPCLPAPRLTSTKEKAGRDRRHCRGPRRSFATRPQPPPPPPPLPPRPRPPPRSRWQRDARCRRGEPPHQARTTVPLPPFSEQ